MKKLNLFLFAVVMSGFLTSCGGGNEESISEMKMTEIDLTEKGIPVKFQAPEGAEIKEGMFMGEFGGVKMYDYEIVKDEFALEVAMDDTDETRPLEEILDVAKETAKSDEGFQEFILEEPNGFIYRVKTDDYEDYKFHYILMKDNRSIEFTEGLKLFTEFTKKDAETLYNIAKNAK